MQSVEVARKAVEVASDKKAENILLLDISSLCDFADYFVICSAETDRQIKAITDAIHETLGQGGMSLRRREGGNNSGWVLLDFGDLIVHVFSLRQREYYGLDRLWAKAKPLVRIQ